MAKQTKMTSSPPPNDKVIRPDTGPDDQAAAIRKSMAPIVSIADNATPNADVDR